MTDMITTPATQKKLQESFNKVLETSRQYKQNNLVTNSNINKPMETNSFLPTDYEAPVTSNYFKLEDGNNRFRVLDSAVVGYEFWKTTDGQRRPVRRRMNEPISPNELEINPRTGEPEKPKHFWAFPVWNVQAKSVQIMEITQKSIMTAMRSYVESEDWGNPKDYDIVIVKSGQKLETTYTVQPTPKKPLDEGVMQLYKDMHINLNALFTGDDPFNSSPVQEITAEEAEEIVQ